MVKYQKQPKVVALDRLIYAISDSTRRRIIDDLVRGERNVGELAEPFKMSAPAISKHIRVLHETGLINTRRVGRYIMCSLVADNLMRVETWMAKYHRFWQTQLSEISKRQ